MLKKLRGAEQGYSLVAARVPCDLFNPWVRWERGQAGIWEFIRRQRLEAWKSGNPEKSKQQQNSTCLE